MNGQKGKRVCVIGAGTMGTQIAIQAAKSGYQVALFDVSEKALAQVEARQKQMFEMALRMGIGQPADNSAILKQILMTTDARIATAEADFISESIPEDLELKRQLHANFESLCKENTIITTNTSSLPVTDIAKILVHPERFAAMHFHSGLGLLVDIMRGEKTSLKTVNSLKEFVKSIGLVPMVMRKETPGYLYNNLLINLNMTALKLAANGSGTPHDIDRAWMITSGNPYGPFGIIDAVGIDLAYDVARSNPTISERDIVLNFLEPYVKRGELGIKTGKGFYVYPDPAYRQPGFLDQQDE